MKKDLVEELIKVANNLDVMGLCKEANSLDKIASKVVLSANPVVRDVSKPFDRTGTYAIDIQNYKSLFNSAYYDRGKRVSKPYPKILKYATNLYNSVVNDPRSPYTKQQKEAFKQQAARIRSDIENDNVDVNKNDGILINENDDIKEFSLNDLLVRNKITDYNGKLLPSIKTRKQLRALFSNLTSDVSSAILLKQYSNTFNILSRNLPEG
jgi:hypothetical protein